MFFWAKFIHWLTFFVNIRFYWTYPVWSTVLRWINFGVCLIDKASGIKINRTDFEVWAIRSGGELPIQFVCRSSSSFVRRSSSSFVCRSSSSFFRRSSSSFFCKSSSLFVCRSSSSFVRRSIGILVEKKIKWKSSAKTGASYYILVNRSYFYTINFFLQ